MASARGSLTSVSLAICILIAVCGTDFVISAEPERAELQHRFDEVVLPFLKSYCFDCHGAERQEGKLNLSDNSTIAAVVRNYGVWQIATERLSNHEMPPASAPKQPSAELRRAVIQWSSALRDQEAKRNAGDPGRVLARRLSHMEYNYTVRDLAGFDIQPTREFPVDPANESGFDNSGESLAMSPALMKKYLEAARFVADHVVLTPNGMLFATHPVVTETDRDHFCVHRIVDFYRQHEVDYADYFFAAWQFENRSAFGKPNASPSDFARQPPINWPIERKKEKDRKSRDGEPASSDPAIKPRSTLSPKYVHTFWLALSTPETLGPLAELQSQWRRFCQRHQSDTASELTNFLKNADEKSAFDTPAIPKSILELRTDCEMLRDLVISLRKPLDQNVEKLKPAVISEGSQPLVLWWNRRLAAQRMDYVGDGSDKPLDLARRRFCRVFPNAFAVASRSHHSNPKLGARVRLLSAGFHLMQGYFRDDQPLCELVLSDDQKADLDFLWKTLNFVTLAPVRQYKDHLFAERAEPPHFAAGPEFDFARPENKEITLQSNLDRMRDVYIAKIRQENVSETVIQAINQYFSEISAEIRWIEQAQLDSQASHLKSLLEFAERAYRRPLSMEEHDELSGFYRSLRDRDGIGHEDAIRDSVASILISPYFCYRFDLASPHDSIRPLNDYELASRLSYFLWSSMPDRELLASAARGELHQPTVLVSQARRMIRDQRIRGLANEFGGNWLEFRRFEEHNGVDRDRFSSFTNELRQAMYEEPIRLFVEIASQNRSVLEFLNADYTFVNPPLAKHYGISERISMDRSDKSDNWHRVENAQSFGRGGLLPMSVFLTKNSPGLRTSPVKRGYWVVRRLLGERIPPPPPEVPELPKDEAHSGEQSLPQLLARHREHKACAGCHQRFDSFGIVFEGFGPIGERRDKDMAGRSVITVATFPDGAEGTGVSGLREYLLGRRKDDFVDNLCRKLFSYALGRGLILSDNPAIDQTKAKLAADGYHFESLIESIVTSPQFLNKRGMD